MKTYIYFLSTIILFSSLFISSCKKEKTPTINSGYVVPANYTFGIVNYSGQTTRLKMMDELVTYMKTANTTGVSIMAQNMKNMYANLSAPFTDTSLNSSGKQIKGKTFSLDQGLFELYMDSLATASVSSVAGSNGVAGVVTSSTDATKKYLLNEKGIEFTQIIEKGLMGAFMYYQICDHYLSDAQIGNGVDNTTIVPGEGTAMEHHWDEAFGYFGVPTDFPSNITGIKYWGKYCNSRNALMNCNSTIMNAFIKGRAAISNKDYTTRDQQRDIIRTNLEKVVAATAISYINSAKINFADDALRNHALSEFVGFVRSLKYSPVKIITQTQIDQVLGFVGNNFYNVTSTNLDNAKNLLSTIYGLDSIKNSL